MSTVTNQVTPGAFAGSSETTIVDQGTAAIAAKAATPALDGRTTVSDDNAPSKPQAAAPPASVEPPPTASSTRAAQAATPPAAVASLPTASSRVAQAALATASIEPLPTASSSRAAQATEARAPSRGRTVLLLLVAAAAVGGAWFMLRPEPAPLADRTPSPAADLPKSVAAPEANAIREEGAALSEASSKAVRDGARGASTAVSKDQAPATASAGEAPPAASAGEAPPASAGEPTPNSADVIVVTVNTIPPDARFFYKGKAVGRSPFRVELKPGERRSFEIGRPGFFARKVVVDGTKKEMTVSMRPETPEAVHP